MLGELVRWKFKIVERGGRSLRELLTRSNIYSKDHCGRDCKACESQKKPQDCRRRGLVYETACLDCCDAAGEPRARYIGETTRSGSERFGEHVEDAVKEKKDSHIYKHWSVHHGGVRTKFLFEILSFYESPLERQVGEAVRIDRTGAERILNSKAVCKRSKVPRIIALDQEEDRTCG